MVEINKQELLKVLNKVIPAIPKENEISQIIPYIKVEKDKIHTSNSNMSIIVPFESNLECSVSAKEFYSLINKLKDETIQIETEDKQLIINGKTIKSGLVLLEDNNIPKLPEIKGRWFNIPGNFIEGVKFCMFSVASDIMNKDAFTCLSIKDTIISSCDDFRATEYSMQSKCPGFLLPLESAKTIVKYDIEKILVQDSYVHFKCKDNTIISCLCMSMEYPAIEHLFTINENADYGEIELPNDFNEIMERISIFTIENKDIVKTVSVFMKKENTTLRCENNETGWAEETVENEYKGKNIQFLANPKFLIELTKLSYKMKIGNNSVLVVGDNFRHVMGLVNG